jgi:hypothetical protein
MKHTSLFAIIALVATQVTGQSNPGYLGNTSAIEISQDIYFPFVSETGPLWARQTAIAYEKSFSKDFALKGGVRLGSVQLDAKNDLGNYRVLDIQGSQSSSPESGSLTYTNTELFVSPRYYFTESGALAPFGSFIGLEFALSNITLDDNIKWNGQALQIPKVTNGVSALSMSVQWGQRRVIFDNFCYNYHFGIGFNLFNTGEADISYFGEGSDPSNVEAVVHSMALNPLQWGRIFHTGVGLSYLF